MAESGEVTPQVGRSFALLAFWVWISAFGCKSAAYTERDIMKDNYWINNDTLQIQVRGVSTDTQRPYSMRRGDACDQAEANIDKHFQELYPEAEKLSYTKAIQKRLYVGEGECLLVVHIAAPGLRGRIP